MVSYWYFGYLKIYLGIILTERYYSDLYGITMKLFLTNKTQDQSEQIFSWGYKNFLLKNKESNRLILPFELA